MPFLQNLHVDKALSEFSQQYANDEYIGSRIAPIVPVQKETDRYFVYGRENFHVEPSLRADRAESNEVDWLVSTSTYALEEHALKTLVTDRARRNADNAIDLDLDATRILTDKLMIRFERMMSDTIMPSTTFQNFSTTAALQWSGNTTTSDPLILINTASSEIIRQSGRRPNAFVSQYATLLFLKVHNEVADRIKYVQRDILTPEIVASLFDVDEAMFGRASFNNNKEGIAFSGSAIWPDDALLYFRGPGSLRSPNAVVTLAGVDSGMSLKVKKWREEKLGGDYVEVSWMRDVIVPSSLSGFLLLDVV